MEQSKEFLKSIVITLEETVERLEIEIERLSLENARLNEENDSLRFQLEEVDGANQAIGDVINKTLESFIMESMLTNKDPVGDA